MLWHIAPLTSAVDLFMTESEAVSFLYSIIYCLNYSLIFTNSISFWYFSISYCKFFKVYLLERDFFTLGLAASISSMLVTSPSVKFAAISSTCLCSCSISLMSLACSSVSFCKSISYRFIWTLFILICFLAVSDIWTCDCLMSSSNWSFDFNILYSCSRRRCISVSVIDAESRECLWVDEARLCLSFDFNVFNVSSIGPNDTLFLWLPCFFFSVADGSWYSETCGSCNLLLSSTRSSGVWCLLSSQLLRVVSRLLDE